MDDALKDYPRQTTWRQKANKNIPPESPVSSMPERPPMVSDAEAEFDKREADIKRRIQYYTEHYNSDELLESVRNLEAFHEERKRYKNEKERLAGQLPEPVQTPPASSNFPPARVKSDQPVRQARWASSSRAAEASESDRAVSTSSMRSIKPPEPPGPPPFKSEPWRASDYAPFSVSACRFPDPVRLNEKWVSRVQKILTGHLSVDECVNRRSSPFNDSMVLYFSKKKTYQEWMPPDHELGPPFPPQTKRSHVASLMVNDLKFLVAENNKTASYKCIHRNYYPGGESINLQGSFKQLESTIRYIRDTPELSNSFSDEALEVMRQTHDGQILRLACLSYYLQYMVRHSTTDPLHPLPYWNKKAMCHEFMTMINHHGKLRKIIGDDLLLLIQVIFDSPSGRFQMAICPKNQCLNWQTNGPPQSAWFDSIDTVPELPSEPGLLLLRAGKGQGEGVELNVKEQTRQDFPPCTWMIHATDRIDVIEEAGELKTGAELGKRHGKATCHFVMVAQEDMELWQQIYKSKGEHEATRFLKENPIMRTLPNNKSFLMIFLIDYVQVEKGCAVGCLTNKLETGIPVFTNSGVPLDAISAIFGFSKTQRHSDGEWWLEPVLWHDKLPDHHGTVRARLGLSESVRCHVPSFFEALAEAYKKKNFYNIQKARMANGYTDDGYPGKIPKFINKDIAKVQERRNNPDRDDETSSSGPGSKGEGKSSSKSSSKKKSDRASEHYADQPSINAPTHKQRARQTVGTVYEKDFPSITEEQERMLEEAKEIKEKELKRRNDEFLKKQEEIRQEAARENADVQPKVKTKAMPRPNRPPPQSKQSQESKSEPEAVKPTPKQPPPALRETQVATPSSPSETTEEPPMAPEKPPQKDDAMEPVEEDVEVQGQNEEENKDGEEEEGPEAEGPEEEEDKEDDDPSIDPDHQPINDDKKDDEDDDDDPRPDGGGSKASAKDNTASTEALGASAKSKPQAPPPDHFDCVDDIDFPELDYELDHHPTVFEKVPSTDDEAVEMEVDNEEEETVEVEVEGEEEEESVTEFDKTAEEDQDLVVNPFDPMDEMDLRRYTQSQVRTVTFQVDKKRLSRENLGCITYKSLYVNVGEKECINCPETCYSMCARCGVYLCFSCRFAMINDPKCPCKCSSAYWTLSPNAYYANRGYNNKLFVQCGRDAENKIQLRDASCDLQEEYENLKSELAKKFDNHRGPFYEGEDVGVFTLRNVPEETYYECSEMTFEEFRSENAGAGYPLRLPSVINYEQWKEEGKPEDDDRFVTPYSADHLIKRLVDVMSRQLEGSVSQNKRDFINAEQTQTGSSSLSVLTLSMGNWQRQHRAYKSLFDLQYQFLHKLIYQNSAHIVCITEADSLTDGMIRDIIYKGGMRVFRLKQGTAPAVMCCVRGDISSSVELLHSSYQDWKRETSDGPRWAFIGGIFRVVFGRLSFGEDSLVHALHDKKGRPIEPKKAEEMIRNVGTYQRHENLQNKSTQVLLCTGSRYYKTVKTLRAKIANHQFPPCEIDTDGQGNEFVSLTIHPVTPEMREKNPTVTDELDMLATPPPAFQECSTDAKRSGFPEAVVGVFHLDHGVAKKPQLSHNVLQRFLQRNLLYQSDFITGDANSAANRFHVKQELCHQRLSLFWYLLESNIRLLNERINEPFKRINAIIECSTRARDEHLSVQNFTDKRDNIKIDPHCVAQLDCMVTAVITYGKYTEHKTSRVKCQNYIGSKFDEKQRPLNTVFPDTINELKVSSVEKFKWTTRRSLMLKPTDGDYHLPLMVHCHVKKKEKNKSQQGTKNWMEARDYRSKRSRYEY